MKTILYQPLFINPQAYFVFPQLYHIEKGDSYIEPANITGQLIINNLSEGLTLTPTVNVIQDSNQVDFSLFKGKHIRISQYTNIGAVVLGEWYIPGTPEPEQPDWFKESIVAWYSPYCKQGLTNYDVIEAYTEDFTTWVYNQNAGVANITSNTITISESFTSQNIVEDTNSPYSDLSIYVTGITEDVYLFVKDMSGRVEEIRKNGLHTFKNNSRFFGFSVNKPAACNIVIKQLPTSILKDFSGNKHDAYLYGFKGKLNSGVGVYKIDFSKSQNANAFDNFERFNNKFIAKGNYNGNWNTFGEYDINGIVKNKVTIKITGLNNVKDKLALEYGYFTTDSKYIKTITLIDKDGVYTYDLNDIVIPEGSNIAHTIYNRMYLGESIINDINLIVEEIPDYPNQLCYNGKSYAVAYGLPILTDYTVIANRTWFAEKVDNGVFMSKALEQNGAFILEYKQGDRWNTYSYYSATNINKVIDKDNSIVYQTKNKYNEQTIYPGDKQDTDTLFIGTIRKDDSRSFIGCHSDILLFNRTLTEYEISWVKNNLMCSKPQEPDENDILKSLVVHYNIGKQGANSIKTTSSLTDYSGNNRNATCKNFDWNTTEFVIDRNVN